jgi:RsiW-degrading membrane proteinase PrsW (M82 family)
MINTSSDGMSDPGWKVSFWVAVLSPLLGMLIGFLAVLLAAD